MKRLYLILSIILILLLIGSGVVITKQRADNIALQRESESLVQVNKGLETSNKRLVADNTSLTDDMEILVEELTKELDDIPYYTKKEVVEIVVSVVSPYYYGPYDFMAQYIGEGSWRIFAISVDTTETKYDFLTFYFDEIIDEGLLLADPDNPNRAVYGPIYHSEQ